MAPPSSGGQGTCPTRHTLDTPLHFTEDTYTKISNAHCTEDTVYAVWKCFILQLVLAFNYFFLSKCDYFAFVYYVESTYLTFCSGSSRAYLVVWMLLLYCLTNKIVYHVCLLRIPLSLYVFGIRLERLGKSGRQPWCGWKIIYWSKNVVYSVEKDTSASILIKFHFGLALFGLWCLTPLATIFQFIS